MWANTTLSSIFRPITTTVTHRSNHRPFTVSAKHPRHQKNIKYNYQQEEETIETTEIDKELELLNQREDGETEDINAYASNSEKISGSAVLLAMQKASAQKTSKKMKMKKKKERMKDVNEDKDKDKDKDGVEDYGDVKPLCIKSDWKDRLDDMEMQLHQLIHHA